MDRRGARELSYDLGDLAGTGAAVAITLFRPGQLPQRWQRWDLFRLGPQNAADGQAHIAARLVRVSPEVAAWAACLLRGIVVLEPWLTSCA